MHKFKVGDKIKILDGREIRTTCEVGWGSSQTPLIGFETYITRRTVAYGKHYYKVNIDRGMRGRWFFSDWLEKVEG